MEKLFIDGFIFTEQTFHANITLPQNTHMYVYITQIYV